MTFVSTLEEKRRSKKETKEGGQKAAMLRWEKTE